MPDIARSTDDLRAVAMACRIGARQAEQDAERQDNPKIKASFAAHAARYSALAPRFENARESPRKSRK
jgi:hypothetical protein